MIIWLYISQMINGRLFTTKIKVYDHNETNPTDMRDDQNIEQLERFCRKQ